MSLNLLEMNLRAQFGWCSSTTRVCSRFVKPATLSRLAGEPSGRTGPWRSA